MTTVINTPGNSVDSGSGAGWSVAVIILIAVVAIGGYFWYYHRGSTTTTNVTNVTIPTPEITTAP